MAPIITQTHLAIGFQAGRREHQGTWHVYLEMHTPLGVAGKYGIPWRVADELAKRLDEQMNESDGVVLDKVLFVMKDRTYELPNLPQADGGPSLARVLWTSLLAKARECEEQEKAPQIVKDNAVLDRLGMPFGLSNDPKIKAATRHEALNSSELRKAIPLVGIKSAEVVGTPTIENKSKKETAS